MIARLIGYLFVGVLCAPPVILLAIALTTAIPRVAFVYNAITTDGKIVAKRCPNQATRHGYQCLPIFRFTASDGQPYTVESSTGGNYSDFVIGRRIKVLYLNDHPQTARIDSFSQLWVVPLIFFFLSGVFAIFPAMILKARFQQPGESEPFETYG